MTEPRSKGRMLTAIHRDSGEYTKDMTVVTNAAALDFAMELTGTSSSELARATGYDRSYVAKVRAGIFQRASRVFLSRAAKHLCKKWDDPTLLVSAMTVRK